MRDLTIKDSGKKVKITTSKGKLIEGEIYYSNHNKSFYLFSDSTEYHGAKPNEFITPYSYNGYKCSWYLGGYCDILTIDGLNDNNIIDIKINGEKKETIKQDIKMVTHKFETNNRLVTLGLSNIEFNDYGIVMTVRDPNDVVETDDVLKQVEFEQKARQIVKSTLEGRVRKQKFISTFTTDMMSRAIAKGYLIELEHRIKKDFNSYVPLGKKAK